MSTYYIPQRNYRNSSSIPKYPKVIGRSISISIMDNARKEAPEHIKYHQTPSTANEISWMTNFSPSNTQSDSTRKTLVNTLVPKLNLYSQKAEVQEIRNLSNPKKQNFLSTNESSDSNKKGRLSKKNHYNVLNTSVIESDKCLETLKTFNRTLNQNLITDDISSLLKKELENTEYVNLNVDKLAKKIDYAFDEFLKQIIDKVDNIKHSLKSKLNQNKMGFIKIYANFKNTVNEYLDKGQQIIDNGINKIEMGYNNCSNNPLNSNKRMT